MIPQTSHSDKILRTLLLYLTYGDSAFSAPSPNNVISAPFTPWGGEGVNHLFKWPAGSSGATIGAGIDLGYQYQLFDDVMHIVVHSDMLNDYQYLKDKFFGVIGLKAKYAIAINQTFLKRIDSYFYTNHVDALETIEQRIIAEKFANRVNSMCSFERMPVGLAVALCSVFYNRGFGGKGSRYSELTDIKTALSKYSSSIISVGVLQRQVATSLLSMRRIWVGKGLQGLLTRRVSEAYMVYRNL